jgi:hypothetical protein
MATHQQKLRNEECRVIYFSPNINQVIKSKMMRGWACSRYGKKGKYVQSFGEEI